MSLSKEGRRNFIGLMAKTGAAILLTSCTGIGNNPPKKYYSPAEVNALLADQDRISKIEVPTDDIAAELEREKRLVPVVFVNPTDEALYLMLWGRSYISTPRFTIESGGLNPLKLQPDSYDYLTAAIDGSRQFKGELNLTQFNTIVTFVKSEVGFMLVAEEPKKYSFRRC